MEFGFHSFGLFWAFVEPACGERDIVVTFSVRCMCVRCACVSSGFVRAETCTFMHEFYKRNWHSYCYQGVLVPFETFVKIG